MKKTPLQSLLIACFAVGLPTMQAQESKNGLSVFGAGFVSGRSDVARSKNQGTTSSEGFDLGVDYGVTIGGAGSLAKLGIDYGLTRFDFEGLLPLPGKLKSLSVPLSYRYKVNEQWSLLGAAKPGWREAERLGDSEAFSVPLMGGALYVPSRDLQCLVGLAYDPFSEYKLLPAAGVSWAFAPDWRVSVGYPKTGLTYAFSRTLSLGWGVSLEAGNYWVKQTPSFAQAAVVGLEPIPFLRDSYLSYRELRSGFDLSWKLQESITVSVSAGAVLDRKWKYHQHDIIYDGQATGYLSASAKFAF